MDITATQGMALQQGLFQQQVGVSLLRQAAQAEQGLVRLLDTAAQPAPVAAPAAGRGALVDITA